MAADDAAGARSMEAARVAASIIQGTPDLAGMAGFDSESGTGTYTATAETADLFLR